MDLSSLIANKGAVVGILENSTEGKDLKMARGHERHHSHHGLSIYGKELIRRCSAHCEMCDAQGVKLHIFEVPPIPTEADLGHCIMICQTCLDQIEHPKKTDPHHWRCLTRSMWSTVPAVKVTALAMLQRISRKEDWATELLEQSYLEPEESEWMEELEL